MELLQIGGDVDQHVRGSVKGEWAGDILSDSGLSGTGRDGHTDTLCFRLNWAAVFLCAGLSALLSVLCKCACPCLVPVILYA